MEFSFETERPRSQAAPSASSNIGSDRLRKAIERNRAKQAKRDSRSPSSSPAQSASRRSIGSQDNVEFTQALRKGNHRAPAPVSYSNAKEPTVVSRGPSPSSRKTTTKALAKSKPRTKTTKKKSKFLQSTNDYVIKGIWVFCGILLLRLIFSDGGVQDF